MVGAKHVYYAWCSPKRGVLAQAQLSRLSPRLLLTPRAMIGPLRPCSRLAACPSALSYRWRATEHAPSLKHVTTTGVPAGAAATEAAGLATRLFALRQPLLTRHAADALAALAGARGAALPAPGLGVLLGGVLGAEGAWERRQPDALLAVVRVLDVGLPRRARTATQC